MYSQKTIQSILTQVSKGKLSPKRAFQKLRHLPYEVLKFANVDHHRLLRMNMPEIVYAPGKTEEQLIAIISAFLKRQNAVFVTRLDQPVFRRLKQSVKSLQYHQSARIGFVEADVKKRFKKQGFGRVSVVTAGTSDVCVAEEAAVMLELLGVRITRHYDCGVAGLHRLLDQLPEIEKANVVICVAGMEGALASVLAGLISIPVIAVPTDVGYGANFKGLAPLLSMMNSCAQGVSVVNINSGFSAACVAWTILNQIQRVSAGRSAHK